MILLPFLAACTAAALTGICFRPGAWYEQLAKPRWRPPNRLFGPAWTVLYLCVAVAGWLAWRQAGFGPALWLWTLQLVLNAAWSPISFGLHRLGLALVDLVALWLAILATIVAFAGLSAAAAWLLAPYLAWVTFAGALNYAVWQMNRPLQPSEARP